jgi:RNA polymerase sigma-70 factor (ECF subfamily)
VLEAFARIYAARAEYKARYAFSTYLYVIVRRICVSELRRARRRPVLWGQEVLPELPVDSAEAEYITKWEQASRVSRLAELDGDDRRLLLGFSLEGKSTRELAGETGMTEGQVRVRLHRIRKRLRKGDDR